MARIPEPPPKIYSTFAGGSEQPGPPSCTVGVTVVILVCFNFGSSIVQPCSCRFVPHSDLKIPLFLENKPKKELIKVLIERGYESDPLKSWKESQQKVLKISAYITRLAADNYFCFLKSPTLS